LVIFYYPVLRRKYDVQKHAFPTLLLQNQCPDWPSARGKTVAFSAPVSTSGVTTDTENWNQLARDARLEHLEAQALETLKITVESFKRPAFPCALIAGDVVCIPIRTQSLPLFFFGCDKFWFYC